MEQPFVSVDEVEEAYLAHQEHLAYKEYECMTGECETCEALDSVIVRLDAITTRLDCDGCGRLVALRTHPIHLVLVLCADCNNGTPVH